MTAEIPVWVNSRLRWVTGIGRKTTCDDVIAVLLREEVEGRGRSDGTTTVLQEGQNFAIMERWRRMERPLDGRSRILRVWNAWGDAQDAVRFTLKRVSDWEADSGRGSPGNSSLSRRRKHHHRGSKPLWPPHHQTLHPRRLAQLHHHNKLPETIERLMKLILAQGETIQGQLRRLHDRDHQIETLEGETHRARVARLGSNYLLETYLKFNSEDADAEDEDEEKGNDSGVVSDRTPPPPAEEPPPREVEKEEVHQGECTESAAKDEAALVELKQRVELWEKLVKVNKRLEREEECLVRLHINFRRLRSCQQADGLQLLPDQELDADTTHSRDALLRDLERMRIELERGTRELEHNSSALAETESLLEARRHYLKRLQAEVEASDRETDRLNHEMVASSQQTVVLQTQQKNPTAACSSANDTDSNSDTGLSSLHSSSEEGVYVLDTLV